MNHLKPLLPDYPRTPHLPYKPNVAAGDSVSPEGEVAVLFSPPEGVTISFQEKVDGANCGIAMVDDHPVIRNRTKILTKGFYKDTQAKKQFLPAWNWFYKNKEKFHRLDPNLTVYGEWMLMAHGMRYDHLPDWFVAYDLFDQQANNSLTRTSLSPCCGLPALLSSLKYIRDRYGTGNTWTSYVKPSARSPLRS